MNLVVLRISSESDCTNGLLFEKTESFGLRFLCYTLEDEYRALKVKGETRIPKGIYNIEYRKEGGFHNKYSKRFPNIHKGMLQVMDVLVSDRMEKGESVTIEYIDFDKQF